jgi:hypothetical protein
VQWVSKSGQIWLTLRIGVFALCIRLPVRRDEP